MKDGRKEAGVGLNCYVIFDALFISTNLCFKKRESNNFFPTVL